MEPASLGGNPIGSPSGSRVAGSISVTECAGRAIASGDVRPAGPVPGSDRVASSSATIPTIAATPTAPATSHPRRFPCGTAPTVIGAISPTAVRAAVASAPAVG